MYGLERTMFRISISPHAAKFTLKGGIFLYALFDGNFTRATTDIDLLAKDTSNDTKAIKEIFAEILQIPVDDAIRQSRWTAFVKKKKAMVTVEFGEALGLFRIFLEPIARAIIKGEDFELKWDYKSKCWK